MDISLMLDDVKLNFRVGAILEYKDKILTEKNDSVTYSVMPGGRVKTLEDTKEALEREIKEELGIDVRGVNSEFISIVENFFVFNSVKCHEIYFVYRYKLNTDYDIKDGMKSLDSASSKYYWKNKEELNKLEILPKIIKEVVFLKEFKRYVVRNEE